MACVHAFQHIPTTLSNQHCIRALYIYGLFLFLLLFLFIYYYYHFPSSIHFFFLFDALCFCLLFGRGRRLVASCRHYRPHPGMAGCHVCSNPQSAWRAHEPVRSPASCFHLPYRIDFPYSSFHHTDLYSTFFFFFFLFFLLLLFTSYHDCIAAAPQRNGISMTTSRQHRFLYTLYFILFLLFTTPHVAAHSRGTTHFFPLVLISSFRFPASSSSSEHGFSFSFFLHLLDSGSCFWVSGLVYFFGGYFAYIHTICIPACDWGGRVMT
ncbi:hypothetical protein EX30DRAFT_48825 [Ascodesmis nigricans]|uniref:Uncharacterized protein n=1 Tax=Ascodesmis nigricans TaxID=341454 RepID=A0A4S2MVS3_9PEZI|nr:hypothetical protein EX30DRAFT_48825 [Ascodesmis nigricans]